MNYSGKNKNFKKWTNSQQYQSHQSVVDKNTAYAHHLQDQQQQPQAFYAHDSGHVQQIVDADPSAINVVIEYPQGNHVPVDQVAVAYDQSLNQHPGQQSHHVNHEHSADAAQVEQTSDLLPNVVAETITVSTQNSSPNKSQTLDDTNDNVDNDHETDEEGAKLTPNGKYRIVYKTVNGIKVRKYRRLPDELYCQLPLCPRPHYNFRYECALRKHVKHIHLGFPCNPKKYKYPNRNRAKETEEKFPCTECSKVMPSKQRLKVHTISVHGIIPEGTKAWVCPYENCGAVKPSQSLLRRHMETHVHPGLHDDDHKGPPFCCPVCGKQFDKVKSKLQHYMKSHNETTVRRWSEKYTKTIQNRKRRNTSEEDTQNGPSTSNYHAPTIPQHAEIQSPNHSNAQFAPPPSGKGRGRGRGKSSKAAASLPSTSQASIPTQVHYVSRQETPAHTAVSQVSLDNSRHHVIHSSPQKQHQYQQHLSLQSLQSVQHQQQQLSTTASGTSYLPLGVHFSPGTQNVFNSFTINYN